MRQKTLSKNLSHTAGLALGRPQFLRADLNALARHEGALTAWHRLFSEHGDEAPSHVDGEFAVGVVVGDTTFLAVDRFSIHTLCYRRLAGELSFAERADDLVDGDAELDPQGLFQYLFFHTVPAPRTIYEGVSRLPAAHCLCFTDGELTIRRYWTPTFTSDANPDFGELRSEFLDLLSSAVREQADRSAIGCFLSGGTDSSTIAGLLGNVTGEPARTYSIGFDVGDYDEMKYARIAARKFGARHHEHYLTPAELVRHIPRLAAYYDQPFGNSSAIPAYQCLLAARSDGIEKMLAGDGGDELFGGNARYAKQKIFDWYGMLPAGARAGLVEPIVLAPALRKVPLLKKASSYVEQARVTLPERMNMYNLLLRIGLQSVFTPAFLAQIDPNEPVKRQRAVWEESSADDVLNKTLAFDWRYTLAENDLRKVCGTAELTSVDVGFPFLDRRLVDFSLRLPACYKVKGLTLRWFFKEALRGFLPNEIIAKKKHGFGMPFGVWTIRNAELRTMARDAVETFAARGVVRPEFLGRLMAEYLPAHPGYYGEMLWLVVMLEQWLRHRVPNYRFAD